MASDSLQHWLFEAGRAKDKRVVPKSVWAVESFGHFMGDVCTWMQIDGPRVLC